MKVLYDADAAHLDVSGERVAIIGYGSQGRAQALNLRDSGARVTIGLRRDGASWSRAEADGFAPREIPEACEGATIAHLLMPDHVQAETFARAVRPSLAPGSMLLFSHGFNVHYGLIDAPAGIDVAMVAPKAPGPSVRETFLAGRGVPALLAVHRDATGRARERALAIARGLGCTRAGVFETTFREETETDLFGEQAVLCGGVSALMKAGFETLTRAGYAPEMAYFECVHELKLIVDLIHARGLAGMREAVSDTAEYGDYTRGPRVVDDATKARMREILAEVQSGAFAREWMEENRRGRPRFAAIAAAERKTLLEDVGAALRARMASGERA